jgi:hypothetical protein
MATLTDILNALHHGDLIDAVYLGDCGHEIPAPAPAPGDDSETWPAFVECPTCGVPRRVLGYDATGGHA